MSEKAFNIPLLRILFTASGGYSARLLELGCKLLLLLTLLSPGTLAAQAYNLDVSVYGIEDGLLHRKIHCFFEDADGFIWLTFSNGIQRFDGHEFTSWTKANAGKKVLNRTHITQDDAGIIWFDAEAFYDPKARIMMGVKEMFPEGIPFPSNFWEATGWRESGDMISRSKSGDFLFLCNRPNRLYRYNSEDGFSYQPFDQLPEAGMGIHLTDSQGFLWIINDKTLFKVDEQGKIFASFDFTHRSFFASIKEKRGLIHLSTIEEYTKAKIDYVIDQNGRMSQASKASKQDSLKQEGPYWLLSPGSLSYRDRGIGPPLASITGQLFQDHFTNQNGWRKEDRKGNLWLSSDSGLIQVRKSKQKFKQYIKFDERSQRSFNSSARNILRLRDTLFVACEMSGVVAIPLGNPEDWAIISKPTRVKGSSYPRALTEVKGQLYIGATEILHSYHGSYKYHSPYPDSEDLQLGGIWSLYEDTKGTIWLGASSRMLYQEAGQDFFTPVIVEPIASKRIIPQNFPLQFSQSEGGNLWLAMGSGLYLVDPDEKKIVAKYSDDQADEYWLPSTGVQYVYTDKDGIRWLGTTEGLIRWNPKTNEKRLFTRLDGLSNNVIYAVFEDKYNHLWLSSDYGIMQFDKESFKVRSFLEKDGITHKEFNRTSAFQDEEGTIYFGGLNGITAFHPDDFYNDEEALDPPMQLSSFQKFDGDEGKEVDLTGQLFSTGEFELYPRDRYFRLKFSLLTFEETERLNYAYKVEGVDESWNYQSANTLQLSKLPYGPHQLIIKGQDASGQWSLNQLAYTIHVVKPIYLKTWFLLLLGSLSITTMMLFFRRRTRQLVERQQELEFAIEKATDKIEKDKAIIENQAQELRELDQLKSRFFANVSHELRTPLALMLGPIRRLIRIEKKEPEERELLGFLERNTLHLKELVNEILDLSKLENHKMELREEPTIIQDYLKSHLSQFYSIGSSNSINIETNFELGDSLVLMLDQKKFEKIINNFLSNAIKFTPEGGLITIGVKDDGDKLLFSVEDSGRGIRAIDLPHVFDRFYQSKDASLKSEGGTGIGLSMSWELAKLMGGSVKAESTWGEGSTFFFSLPKRLAGQYVAVEDKAILVPGVTAPISLPPDRKHRGSSKILVVEDNDDLRAYYKIILRGYDLTTTRHGQEAIDYLEKNALPDLIISDLMMPVMDGMELLSRLKGSDQWRHLPVIMLTAKTNQQVKLKALRYGIDDYVNKPFDDDELLIRIENLLHHQAERAIDTKPSETEALSIPERPKFTQSDMEWLEGLERYILSHIEAAELSVASIAYEFAVSESTLLRQLKKLTGLTPNKYLRELRLNQAREHLQNRRFNTVAEVAYGVGFRDAAAFTRSFKKRFGKAPSEIGLSTTDGFKQLT